VHQRPQRKRLIGTRSERREAVAIGAGQLAQNHRVETVVLAGASMEVIARGRELIRVR
jgi:hypothetical protein